MSAGRARPCAAAAAVFAALSAGCIDTSPTAREEDTAPDAGASTPEVAERSVEVVLHRPQAVFLLDHSASMSTPSGAAGATRWEELVRAVTAALSELEEVDLGAVFFNNEIEATIAVGPRGAGELRAALAELLLGPGGGTVFAPPLAAASALFAAAPPAARFLLLATDGSPNFGQDVGRGEIDDLRAAGVTIFTVFVGFGDDDDARALLLSLSGPTDRAADPRFAAQATDDPAALDRALADFATWVRDGACRFTLPDDAPGAGGFGLFVVTDGVRETPLAPVPAGALHDQPSPAYAPLGAGSAGRTFALSWAACAPLLRDGAELVLRWSPAAPGR